MASEKEQKVGELPKLDLRSVSDLHALQTQLLASSFPVLLPSFHPLGLERLREALLVRKTFQNRVSGTPRMLKKDRSNEDDNANSYDAVDPRNRSVSDSVLMRCAVPTMVNGPAVPDLDSDSPMPQLNAEFFGIAGKMFLPPPEDGGLEDSEGQSVPESRQHFFENPKMILSAAKPSVVTWTSTPIQKVPTGADERAESPSKPPGTSPSRSQSSSPSHLPQSDAENKSDTSRATFDDSSLSGLLPGCDQISSDEQEPKAPSQSHLMETDGSEMASEGTKLAGRPPKMVRCKLCEMEFFGKENLWKHLGEAHFKGNALRCDFCPFVTRYRHHYDYHLRNHFGEKPFRCDKCEYKCVNKSMLASHQKSHTNVYQYKCETCGYASKYFHSMKQHADKTQHKISQAPSSPRQQNGPFSGPHDPPPASSGSFSFPSNVVLPIGVQGVPLLNGMNLISSPNNPQPFMPPRAPQELNGAALPPGHLIPTSALGPTMFLNPATSRNDFTLPANSGPALPGPLGAPLALQQFQNALSLLGLDQSKLAGARPAQGSPVGAVELAEPMSAQMVPPPLLSCPQIKNKQLQGPGEDRAGGPDQNGAPKEEAEGEEAPTEALEGPKAEPEVNAEGKVPSADAAAILASLYYCKHCEIFFKNPVTYQCHVGCHNFDDPFKCNRCGFRASDTISFMNHHMCAQL